MTNPPYPLHPEQMTKSWLERNPRMKIPLGLLMLFVLIGGFSAGILWIIMTSFHRSDVHQQAVGQASQDFQVRERLGEPIKASWFVMGQLKVSNGSGYANLSIPISGPKGKGTIHAIASKNSRVWRFTRLQVRIDGEPDGIDLLSVQPPGEHPF